LVSGFVARHVHAVVVEQAARFRPLEMARHEVREHLMREVGRELGQRDAPRPLRVVEHAVGAVAREAVADARHRHGNEAGEMRVEIRQELAENHPRPLEREHVGRVD